MDIANLEDPASPSLSGIDAQIQRDKLSQLKGFMKTRELANSEIGLRAPGINQDKGITIQDALMAVLINSAYQFCFDVPLWRSLKVELFCTFFGRVSGIASVGRGLPSLRALMYSKAPKGLVENSRVKECC
jgi:hypothetical protein